MSSPNADRPPRQDTDTEPGRPEPPPDQSWIEFDVGLRDGLPPDHKRNR